MKVMIIGGGARHQEADNNTEIWGINGQFLSAPGIKRDRMFDLHHYYILERDGWDFSQEINFHNQNPSCPLYVLEQWPLSIKKQKLFPFKEIMDGFSRGKYHCGSFDWLVAYAIYLELFDEIILNGISLSIAELGEPLSARACLEYWCGYAEAEGTAVTAKDCDLFSWMHITKTNQIYSIDDVTVMEDRT